MKSISTHREPIARFGGASAVQDRICARTLAAGMCLMLVLITAVPVLLRCPLWADAITFDCYAQIMQLGGVMYRDAYEVNLPGMTWLHLLVRSCLGWSDLALRAVDLCVYFAIAVVASRWLDSTKDRLLLMLGLIGFYVSMPEIYHCQRDFWMLLPMLLALNCRLKAHESATDARSRSLIWTFAEGLLWGIAIWIKPYAIMPILTVVLADGVAEWGRMRLNQWLTSAATLLGAGLVAGGGGFIALATTGSLLSFMDVMLVWRPVYDSNADLMFRIDRWVQWFWMYMPWSFLLPPAVVIATVSIVRNRSTNERLLAAFFLGWLGQAITLQHPHVYVLGALLPVGMLVIMRAASAVPAGRVRGALSASMSGFAALALFVSPAVSPHRMSVWWESCTALATNESRDNLAMIRRSVGQTTWQELEPVVEYLQSRKVADGELTCFHIAAQALYLKLRILPSTRYLAIDRMELNYRPRMHLVAAALEESNQRFVVTDLLHTPGYSLEEGAKKHTASLPPNVPANFRQTFPWNLPIVFRSGRYLVHELPVLQRSSP